MYTSYTVAIKRAAQCNPECQVLLVSHVFIPKILGGIIMKAKISKSKVSNPFGEAELPFFFDRGFVSYDDIKPIRAELMKKRKAEFNV